MMNKTKLITIMLVACTLAGQLGTLLVEGYSTRLEVSASDLQLTAGQQNSITITLSNSGSDNVTEVEAILISAISGLTVVSDSHKIINTIPAGENVTYNPTLYIGQSIGLGSYQLTLQLNYKRLGTSITASVPIAIVVTKAFQPMIQLSTTADSLILKTGMVNDFSFTAQNIGDIKLTEVDIILSSLNPLISITGNTNFHTSEISSHSTKKYTTKVNIFENTPIGTYSLSASIYYTDINGNRYSQTAILPFEIDTITVSKSPIFIVENYKPGISLQPNDRFPLNLNVTCLAADAFNVKAQLTLDQKGFVAPQGPTTIYLGDLKRGDKMNITYALQIASAATPGQIPLTVTLRYSDPRGIAGVSTETVTVNIEPAAQVAMVVKNLKPTLTINPGDQFTLELETQCRGAQAYNAKAQLTLDTKGMITTLSPTMIYLGDIAEDSTVKMTYNLQVDGSSAPGQIPLTLTLRYTDSNGVQGVATEILTINVDEIVIFRLLKAKTFTMEQGKQTKIEADLLLIGTARIDFTSVTLVVTKPFTVNDEGSEYLGAIDPDSPVPFTVTVNVPSSAEIGDYKVPLKVTYMDHRNVLKEQSFDLQFTVVKPVVTTQNTSDGGIWGWIKSILGLR